MKFTLTLLLSLSALNVYAGTIYDNTLTVCKKGNLELTLKGKNSFLGSRDILVSRDGQTILNESYAVETYEYNEHNAQYFLQVPAIYNDILKVASKAKPKSVHFDADFTFRVSDNAYIYQTYDGLNPKYGGETSALILQLVQYKEFVIFDFETQCRVSRI